MLVHAPIAAVGTRPQPAVFPVLDRLDEVFADFVRGGFRVAVFAQHDLPQLRLVPRRHVVFPSAAAFFPFPFFTIIVFLLFVPRILIQIPLGTLPPHLQIMAEFALLPLLAVALLEELAHHRLGVHPEWHLLDLDRLEQFGRFAFRRFRRGFFALPGGFFGVFPFLLGRFGGAGLRLDGFDLFLRGGAFFLFFCAGGLEGIHGAWME